MNFFNKVGMPTELLLEAIKSDDVSKVYTALEYLDNNIPKETNNKVLSEWSRILSGVNLQNSVDVQLLYAEVFYKLHKWKRKKVLPDWRKWEAPVIVEIKWRQLEIYLQTEKVDFNDLDEITLQALYDLDTKKILYPEKFFEKISSLNNYKVQNIVLKLIKQSLNKTTLFFPIKLITTF